MKRLAVGTILVLLSGAASAEPFASYTQTTGSVFFGPISESDAGQSFPDIDMPLFNPSLGSLQSVAVDVNVHATFSITNKIAPPLSFGQLVPATLAVEVFCPARNCQFPAISGSAYGSGQTASITGDFAQTFTDSDPNEYGNYMDYNSFFIGVYGDIPSLAVGGEAQDTEYASYDFTETFFYAPATAIPEPGSTGLLLAGLICTAGVACRRHRKYRPL